MKKTIENKIRLKAVLIYLVIAALCGSMVGYLYSLRMQMQRQRSEVVQYYRTLQLANKLIYSVNDAQSMANLYISSRSLKYLERFYTVVDTVEQLIDSMAQVDSEQQALLHEVSGLLHEKACIISEFNKQFAAENPLMLVSQRLRSYSLPVKPDSVIVHSEVKDTTIVTRPTRGFWQRLSEAFSPSQHIDTVMTKQVTKIDTLQVSRTDALPILSEASSMAEEAGQQYSRQLVQIERQVTNLMVADQEISTQLSILFLQLHSRATDSAIAGLERTEQLIRQNNVYSIVGGVVALLLILIFILLIIGDVNKGKAARKALEEANFRTKELMESRHKLLLSVSHDIKTPLGAILGYLELWQNGQAVTKKELQSIQSAGSHIMAMLENLLEFSKLEQGKLKLEACDFSIRRLCSEITGLFEPLARQKNLAFYSHCNIDKTVWLHADMLKIKQIITNVLSNAFKYTNSGSIEWSVTYSNEKLSCTICDTGAGIPAGQLDTIFEPFARVEQNSAMATGSGFGLYVVKGFADLLGGAISVASEVGKGSQFTITIPANRVVAPQHYVLQHIMLVDDDAAFLAMLKGMLESLGHRVTVCDTPTTFEAVTCNAVLTDMEMGAITGCDVLQKIKKENPETPVFIMTGRGDFSKDAALQMGFDGYLQKPVNMDTLQHFFGGCKPATTSIASLDEWFGGDIEAARALLEQFAASTIENVALLQQVMDTDNFAAAQALCHKMLPMFLQLGATDAAAILQKMDSLRGRMAADFPEWKEKIRELIRLTKELVEKIRWQL